MTTAKSANNDVGEAGAQASAAPRDARRLHAKRRFAHLARWLHTYLSMLSFALLFFSR